jgi:hypothetical protein
LRYFFAKESNQAGIDREKTIFSRLTFGVLYPEAHTGLCKFVSGERTFVIVSGDYCGRSLVR